ncbi:MAG: Na+/H+ antiporter subunit E [Armatimonadota bacterium]|nr:Na+/H+ antiporter subunit E [Armatimonadota bacterium]MDR7548839.1 Na+/H+ antiporter subunit E [Armatimonadota bacterium]
MLRRVWSGVVWLVTFVTQNVVANLTVAGLVLRPWKPVRSGVVRLPLDLTTAGGITMLAHSITLVPGTMTVDVAPDRSHLLVHVLALDDPQATVEEIKRTLERPIRGLLE